MQKADFGIAAKLANLDSEFQPNELAYLALTTKVEHPIRDRLAFRLHQDYDPHFVVAREWHRIDLAVLDPDGTPAGLVELKAMYTFDAFGALKHYTHATTADEEKALRLAHHHTSVYSLLLATHLDRMVPAKLARAVKYSAGINRAIVSRGDAAAVHKEAISAISQGLTGRSVVSQGEINGGSAFGIGVSVLYWLVKNGSRFT